MISSLKALGVTLRSMGRKKVTAEYPKEHLPVDNRYMGFPALLWDDQRVEPFCTGCMVCVRYCPTQCMSAEMHDNPKFAEGDSHRRKIIKTFEINLNRCILCGICVDVCNFDAIEMSHEHELAGRGRNDQRVDLGELLTMGKKYQADTAWKPSKPNAPSPKEKEAASAAKPEGKPIPEPVEGSVTAAKPAERPAPEASTSSATGNAAKPAATASSSLAPSSGRGAGEGSETAAKPEATASRSLAPSSGRGAGEGSEAAKPADGAPRGGVHPEPVEGTSSATGNAAKPEATASLAPSSGRGTGEGSETGKPVPDDVGVNSGSRPKDEQTNAKDSDDKEAAAG